MALVMALGSGLGCELKVQPSQLCKGPDCFDIPTFADKLEEQLSPCAVGWGFVIYHDGSLHTERSGGMMRTEADPPALAFSSFEPANVASVSKTFTATAVLQLLDANGLTPDDLIHPWLPPEWTRGQGIEDLTFRQVLTHSAGFRGTLVIAPPFGDEVHQFWTNVDGNQDGLFDGCNPCLGDYASLQDMVAVGSFQQYRFPQYDNVNYQLLRVLIAMLDGLDPNAYQSWPDSAAEATAERYEQYMLANVFAPAGALNAVIETPEHAMRYYPFPDGGRNGFDHGEPIPGVYFVDDERAVSGAGFWNIPLNNMAGLLWTLRNTETLLPASLRDAEMFNEVKPFNELLGMYSQDVEDGKAFKHNGGFSYSLYQDSDCDGMLPDFGCPGGTSIWFAMPNDLVVTLHHNSVPNNLMTCGQVMDPDTLVTQAYKDSWVP
jgi:CubicO group peptidase (beta-lactamase class C family)